MSTTPTCPHCHDQAEHQAGRPNLLWRPTTVQRIIKAILSAVILICSLLLPAELFFLKIILIAISFLVVSLDVIIGAITSLRHKQIMDENFLMSVAAIGAMAIGEFAEGIAVMIFFQVGEYFQEKALAKSEQSIATLMDIKPDTANLKLANNQIEVVAPDQVEVGAQIMVKVGEKIPVDGIIIEGESALDTQALTGESWPQEVAVGDEVLSGCINQTGVLTVQTTKTAADSTASKIVELVDQASTKKSQAERFITRFARVYTPIVIAVTILIILIMPFGGGWSGANFSLWLQRALVFLVVACPCALVISVPLSFSGGLGNLARQGILVKGTTYLEKLTQVSTMVFDKTGTLTTGQFKLQQLVNLSKLSDQQLLTIVMSMESYSNHPLAKSLVTNFDARQLRKNKVSNFKEIAGMGISGQWQQQLVLIGNQKILTKFGLEKKIVLPDEENSATTMWIIIDGQFAGYLQVADQLKADAQIAVNQLKQTQQIKQVVMLTGDNQVVAADIAGRLGIDDYQAQLLPADKMMAVEKLQADNQLPVAVIGDGINDAPILKRADIGIAMGQNGTDAAIAAADIVIMTDQLSRLPVMLKVAKKTTRIARQNIVLALSIKVIVMGLSFFGLMSMWLAVFADVGVTLLAILNALRALKVKTKTAQNTFEET